MSESCYTSEIYALYVIGSLDGPDFSDFDGHIRTGCAICRSELVQARQLWSTYALATEPVAPRPELRERLLAAAARSAPIPMPARRVSPPRAFGWRQMAAAIAILGIGLAVGWKLHGPAPPAAPEPTRIAEATPPPAPPVPTPAPVTAPPSLAPQLEQENLTLRARIDELNKTLAAQQAQLAQGSPELQQRLARTQAESAGAAQALQQEQSRTAQLQQQLSAAETRAGAADNDRKLAADREARLRETTAARIRQLEGENEKFRRVVDEQQRRIQQNTQLVSFFTSPNLRFYQYEGTRNGPSAKAHVVTQAGNRALFYAFHLPQLPAGRTYQLWLIRGQSPAIVSGGIFRADQDGNAVVEVADPAMLKDIRQFAVTDEPAGGSPGPTGKQFFRAAT